LLGCGLYLFIHFYLYFILFTKKEIVQRSKVFLPLPDPRRENIDSLEKNQAVER